MASLTNQSDVLIVGAGPCGVSAAYDLAKAGLSVQLLDKETFPRMKPCAGGLTLKTLRTLRFSVAPVSQRVCNHFVAGYGLQKMKKFTSDSPIAVMTVRSELDAYCLDKSIEAGAKFNQIGPIRDIAFKDQLWTLECEDQRYQARWLIGADGANSRVRSLLFPENQVKFAFAAEACVPHSGTHRFEMEMFFNYGLKGYAWVFPKKDHLNIGIYSLEPFRGVKSLLVEFCRERLSTELDPKTIIGHRIPYNGHNFHHKPGTPLLAGDAAGMADPLLGEGLYNAVRSGQIAASSILKMASESGDSYGEDIGEITGDLKSYWSLTRFFYNHPNLGYRILCSAPGRYASIKTARMGWTISHARRRFWSLPFQRPDNQMLIPFLELEDAARPQ